MLRLSVVIIVSIVGLFIIGLLIIEVRTVPFLPVRKLMLLHVILSDKSLIADITFEWSLTGMNAGMPLEVSFVGEYLRADIATVPSRTGVHLDVFSVQFFVRKTLAALRAFKRLLARMEAFVMLRKIAASHKKFITVNAFMNAILRNKIGSISDGLTLLVLRIGLALTLLLRL